MTFWKSIENTEEEKKDEFDHSPYLIKDEQETPRKKPENSICMLHIGESQRFLRCKSSILQM